MTHPIEHSFELAAARAEDLTPLIYARLHREHPETLAMFRTEGSDLVKGSMLVVRFQHSHPFAATTFANVGIKGPPAKY